MKKVISVFLAVMFIFASVSVMVSAAKIEESVTCKYCGETFDDELSYVAHMKKYNPVEGHYKVCPYTGEDYKDGGCGESFATVSAYEYHVDTCPYKDDLSTSGNLKSVGGTLLDAVKGIDWGTLFNSIVSIVKALVKGVNWSALLNTVKGIDWGSLINSVKN